jgi:hypothetical protein
MRVSVAKKRESGVVELDEVREEEEIERREEILFLLLK